MSIATLVVSANIRDLEKVKSYKEVAGKVLKRHGGEFPPKSREVTTILAGENSPKMLLEVNFPNEDSIMKAFNDPEYKAVISLRDEGFSDLSIFIAK